MRDVSFGQYYPADSVVHRCDPRTKLLFLIVYIAAVFTAKNFYGLAACAIVFVLVAALSRVPIGSVLRSVKAIVFLLIFTAVLNLFFYSGETILWQWKFLKFTKEGIFYTIFLSARLFLLVMGSAILTLTTTPVSLTDGIESLLFPLKLIRFPVHELALIMSIALRFIPLDGRNGADHERAEGARRGFRIGRTHQADQGGDPRVDSSSHQRFPPGGRTRRRDGREVLFGQQGADEI